jgi:hypothetical protein
LTLETNQRRNDGMKHEARRRKWIGRPSPAMAVAVIGVLIGLTGTAFGAAALGKNSVGPRQLRSKAVTTGKIADNAVNGAKVANGSLTGQDINVGAIGTVPSALEAQRAGEAGTVGGHAAACPAGSTLIRGLCFDTSPGPVVANVKAATDACAARGGYLPSPLELYSVRGILNLGTGVGSDVQLTDSYFNDPSTGNNYSTVVIDGSGTITQRPAGEPGRYTCVYPLVR